MNTNRILFVTITNESTGIGHLKRCHTIADEAYKIKWDISMLILCDKPINFKCEKYKYFYECSEIEKGLKIFKTKNQGHYDLVISDIVISNLVNSNRNIDNILSLIKQLGNFHFCIDSLGSSSLYSNNKTKYVDKLIIPYIVEKKLFNPYQKKIIYGKDYAIISSEYKNIKKKEIVDKARKILLTAGGSDPLNFTNKILTILELINYELDIKIIIGPLFSQINITEINKCISQSSHNVEAITNPSSLFKYINWSDLAISASGLTKYELAATGTPSMLFSMSRESYEINKIFIKESNFIDLGFDIQKSNLYELMLDIVNSKEKRLRISRNSYKLFDGEGTKRIISNLSKHLKIN